jgi:hypothetical protein
MTKEDEKPTSMANCGRPLCVSKGCLIPTAVNIDLRRLHIVPPGKMKMPPFDDAVVPVELWGTSRPRPHNSSGSREVVHKSIGLLLRFSLDTNTGRYRPLPA